MFKHKYIRLFNTEEEYQEALDNRELEEVAVSAIIGDRKELPDTYQYSIRTTNGDDKVLGKFNKEDDIEYFGGLEIIWGYWGWVWKDIEYGGETLHGGQFDPIKNTTTYPEILDGYRLQHIDNLTSRTAKVSEVGHFDASNVVSAQNAFNKSLTWVYINTYDWPKLKRADNMFYVISKDLLRGHDLNMPELVEFNAPLASIFRYDDETPIHVNLGKLEKLYLPNTLYYNNNSCDNSYYSIITRFPVNKMFTGLDNCYDFNVISIYKFVDGATVSRRKNLDIEVTYEGDKTVNVPPLSSYSRFKLKGYGKFGDVNTVIPSATPTNALVTSYGDISLFGTYAPLDTRRYVKCIEAGLDVDYDKIAINNPYGYLAGFYFKDDDELPFYSKLRDAFMYSYCRFDNMNIEFDCSEGSYGTYKTYTEFYQCRFYDCSLVMKNILNHDTITLSSIQTSTNTTIDIGLSDYTELNEKEIKISTYLALPDIKGVEFINCSLSAKVNMSDCIIRRSRSISSWVIRGNLSNVNINSGPSKYSAPTFNFNGEMEDCVFSAFGNDLTLTAPSGDLSKVTINLINEYSNIRLTDCVKTPVLSGYKKYSSIINNNDVTEEIYAEDLDCYNYSATGEETATYTLDLSKNTVLRILNLGRYWQTLKVNHAKLLDKDTLYASIQRRSIEPKGELWLHRNVWEQYTQEEQDYINSQFDFVNIVIDETEGEDKETEQES